MSDMQKNDETKAVDQTAKTPSEPKAKKAKAAKKEDDGMFARIGRWFREMRSELKKVSWPSRQSTLKQVGTVIACVLVVGVCIWVFDWVIHAVVQALLNLF